MKTLDNEMLRLLTSRFRLRPSFLIIGSQRCGSTSLYRYICNHPHVLPAVRKEVHYYDANFERGSRWYHAHFPMRSMRRSNDNETLTISGEASPEYMLYPFVPSRVFQDFPDIKIVAVLREPVSRAYSQYQRALRRGWETLSFPEAVEAEEARTGLGCPPDFSRLTQRIANQEFTYLSRGYYARQLKTWFEFFPRQNIFITSSEQLFGQPDVVTRRAWAFLGLDPGKGLEIRGYAHNRQNYTALNDGTRERLAARFAPHNRELFELCDQEFPWKL
jgi:hypothetical protein